MMARKLIIHKSVTGPHPVTDEPGLRSGTPLPELIQAIKTLTNNNMGYLVKGHTHRHIPETLHFDNDDAFTDFCLESKAVVLTNDDTGLQYFDYPFTEEYLDAVRDGDSFHIDDPDSKVMRRGCVCRGIITKWVDNLV